MEPGYLFLITLGLLLGYFCFYFIQRRKGINQIKSLMKDEPFPYEMVMVKWNNFELPMRYSEYTDRWVQMPHNIKRDIARRMKRELASGKVDPAKFGIGANLQVIEDKSK